MTAQARHAVSPLPALPLDAEAARQTRLLLDLAGQIRAGRLALQLPDGTRVPFAGPEPGPEAAVILNRPRLADRLVADGSLGLADAYLDGDFDTPDLARLLELLALNRTSFAPVLEEQFAERMQRRLRGLFRRRNGEPAPARPALDYGASFYEAWLDPTLGFGVGLFATGEERLEVAQWAKFATLGRMIGLKAGQHVLDLDCGFGAFAAFAAGEIGARVTALARRPEHEAFARRRMQALGLADRVDVRAAGERVPAGPFDRVAAIGTLPQLGDAAWPGFLAELRACLAEGGRAGLETAVLPDALRDLQRAGNDVLRRDLFPGASLPTARALAEHARRAGLDLVATESLAGSAARTLGEWRQRFVQAWPHLSAQDVEPAARRLWDFALAYGEAALRTGRADVLLVALGPA